ncbi:Endonuclease/Exonuclease/phosphatase family protein [Flavobacteriaceae bacterium MAR_2010_188]|nr:Endonuclease/Exonuclease/phosphatase family protein [Flavobacteriaceae bacterium MAR_2010_188]
MDSNPKNILTIAFYNLENLYDTENDSMTNDDDFLPTADRRWTNKRYDRKLYKIGTAISQIGKHESAYLPALIGLAEVENKTVLRDLIKSKDLSEHNYDFVHYDSYDERGIDVALLYNKDLFKLESSEIFPVLLEDEFKTRDFTRDVLLVTGKLQGELISVVLNHWPSRREGEVLSGPKRQAAAEINVHIVEKLRLVHNDPKIVIMGDFNDNPDDSSITYLTDKTGFYNAVKTVWSIDKGSQNHNFNWNFFDQMIISPNFFKPASDSLKFEKAEVFNEKFLTQYNGKFAGQPYRTYAGKRYKGGFSDHFPVYILLSKGV